MAAEGPRKMSTAFRASAVCVDSHLVINGSKIAYTTQNRRCHIFYFFFQAARLQLLLPSLLLLLFAYIPSLALCKLTRDPMTLPIRPPLSKVFFVFFLFHVWFEEEPRTQEEEKAEEENIYIYILVRETRVSWFGILPSGAW